MKALTDLNTDTLEWRASTIPGVYQLSAGEGVYAILAWSENDTIAQVETADGKWSLKRVGVLAKHITLRESGSETNLAEFHPHTFMKGRLVFHDGTEYHWTHQPHEDAWAFVDAKDHIPLRMKILPPAKSSEPGQALGRVVLGVPWASRHQMVLLAALGWTIHLLAAHDANVQEGALAGSNLI